MKTVALVIAGNYKEYDNWIRENNLNRLDYKYICNIEQYRGFRDIPILLIGQYYDSDLDCWKVASDIQTYERNSKWLE